MADENTVDRDALSEAGGAGPSEADRVAAEAAAVAAAVGSGEAKPSRAKRARQTAQNAAVPFLIALGSSIAFQYVINAAVPAEAYLYRLFRPAGGWVMSVVPALIFFVLVWTLADLAIKWRAGVQNDADMKRPEIGQLPMLITQDGISAVLARLSSWDRGILTRQVGRRMHWLLHHLETTDPKRAHELLRHQSDLDADTGASSYAAVRLFIWAMPILGFIGTVLGISLAVGGFSDFLTTDVNIDEIDTVTAELGNVASGLSFAFDTTLLGLLAGLVASVCSSAVQHREERLLTRLDEFALRVLASATAAEGLTVTAPAAPVESAAAAFREEFEEALEARLHALHEEIEQFTVAVRSSLDGLRDASSLMNSGLNNSISSVSDSVHSVGKTVQGVADTLNDGMDGISGRMNQVERSNENLSSAYAELSTAFGELSGRLAELRETQAALTPILNQLAGPLELKLVPTRRPQPGGAGDD